MKVTEARRGPLPFDIFDTPLDGAHLIEAGAGTGKTYALESLFIRLMLEKDLQAREILVVTYTVAATKELRGRIRDKVRAALEAFRGGKIEDEFIRSLVGKFDNARAAGALETALREFDMAPVFTIHGFCQRVLRENAFESGTTFDAELLADDAELRAQVLEDFWRNSFYRADPDFFRYAGETCGLDKLRELLVKGTAQPQIQIIPDLGPVELPSLEPLRENFRRLGAEWRRVSDEVIAALSSPALNMKKIGSQEKLAGAMESYLNGPFIFPLFKDFKKFTTAYLADCLKKDCECPSHPFFDRCAGFQEAASEFQAIMDRKVLSLKGEMFKYFRSEFARRKESLNIQSFEDLLTRLNRALEGSRGETLALTVRSRYKAALIDEFQDTDPVQYSIFKRIFAEGTLFLIGDPKQAIYGFRGADLFTYLQAASEIENRHTLLTNRRSQPRLIDAVNTLFAAARNPFLFDEIEFRKADSEPNEKLRPLTFEGAPEPPFHIWLVRGGEKPLTKERATDGILRAVAAETARLVGLGREGKAMLGDRGLREADIAILVRKNREARMVQEALRELNINSVLYSDADLFASEEAVDLERVLRTVAEPFSERHFRAGLCTNLIGLTAESLEALLADGPQKEDRHARFRSWRETWERSGFMVMYRRLLLEEKARERLLAWPDGERRLTNYLHLGEILHREAAERKLGVSALVDWLALRRSEEMGRPPEERQLRLESDAEAVKVVTVHMSKGLEFPIVFCPFSWDGSWGKRDKKKDYLLYHEERKLKLDLSRRDPESEARARTERRESLAEDIRLLYVALTRAKNRCCLVWGRISGFSTSAAAYILHPLKSAEGDGGDVLEELEQHMELLSPADLGTAMAALAKKSKGAIAVCDMPSAAGETLAPPETGAAVSVLREFRAPLEKDWLISSFSSLASSSPSRPEFPDYDRSPEGPAAGTEASITGFPRGASAGTFFHRLFEEMDFQDAAGLDELVRTKLGEHGYPLDWAGPVSLMARGVLAADLDGAGLTLASIAKTERLNELGFYLPLKHISPASLADIFAEFSGKAGAAAFSSGFPERVGKLEFAPRRGFMRGFIDLVFMARGRFYLVDWKSNFLGNSPGDYNQSRLAVSMEEHLYFLQYHLYCLALHRYLLKRLPGYSYEKDFGGVFYIYLRGFGGTGGAGIFADRPGRELMEALDRGLVRMGEGGGYV